MCNPGAVSVAPKTDVNTVTGNSSSSDHSVKDSTNTEVNIQVTTSFAFLVLCCLMLLLLVVYYLWSKHHHRVTVVLDVDEYILCREKIEDY